MQESKEYKLDKPQYGDTTNISLATELLQEVKSSAKRWFIAFIVVLCLWFATIGVFVWYISLPVEVTENQVEQQSDNNSNNYVVGGDYNGGVSESNTESNETGNENTEQ